MTALRRDAVIVACAVSAGIHGALAPEHFGEGAAAGVAFVVSTVALGAVALALTVAPARRAPLVAAAALFGGLLVAYALAVTTGLPLLHPDAEAVDALALVTKAVEAAGLVAASTLLAHRPFDMPLPILKGTT